MGYAEATAHFDALGIDQMKSRRPSTARIEALCEALNHPERSVPAIHITGTNGKTSTARIATMLLAATGLKVGSYTSPHLQTIRERICLDGEPVSEDVFGDVFDHLNPYLELVTDQSKERISYFEVMTALFFLWAAENVDVMVVEVGMGGKWDATNVVPASLSVVTNVGLDHTGLLGADKETIAKEKAGIIKPGSLVVTAERDPSVLSVIKDEAHGVSASLSVLERDFRAEENRLAFGGRFLTVATSGLRYEGLFLPLHGSHQGVNAATALEAVTSFLPERSLSPEVAAQGLQQVQVPGRLETVRPSRSEAVVVLDVAHNPDGAAALVTSLSEAFAFDRVRFVVGFLSDKDYRGVLFELARLPCTLVLTRPRSVRSAPTAELERTAAELGLSHEVIDAVDAAVDSAIEAAAKDELVCITGSHYVVGEALDHISGSQS